MGNKNTKVSTTKEIEKKMRIVQQKDSQITKILILGAGSCGKSTLLKQLKYLYIFNEKFPENEIKDVQNTLKGNIEDIMHRLCEKSMVYGLAKDMNLVNKYLNWYKQKNNNRYETKENAAQNIEKLILKLWKSNKSGIKEVFKKRDEFYLLDNSEYLIDNIERIYSNDYTPNTTDIMNYRSRTTGVVREGFEIKAFNNKNEPRHFHIYDVGGERCERRKWIKLFDNVNCVIFMISLAGYNQVLFEDNKKNKLLEALELFHHLAYLKYFTKTQFVVFLNKYDLFCEKIKTIPFDFNLEIKLNENSNNKNNSVGPSGENMYVCKYNENDKHNSDKVIEWLTKQIRILDSHNNTFVYVTQANDTKNVQKVFGQVQNIIIKNKLVETGLV